LLTAHTVTHCYVSGLSSSYHNLQLDK